MTEQRPDWSKITESEGKAIYRIEARIPYIFGVDVMMNRTETV
jgi:hypothetical protein